MSAGLAATKLRIALRDGDEMALRRLLRRPDLPAIAVELARIAGPIPKPLLPCGTRAAYWRHRDRSEPICGACREAERKYNRERKRAVRAGTHVPNHRKRDEQIRWRKSDEMDEVAVRRAVDGDPPERMTKRERREAVRVLHARGCQPHVIAERLGTYSRMVHRDLVALGLAAAVVVDDQEAAS